MRQPLETNDAPTIRRAGLHDIPALVQLRREMFEAMGVQDAAALDASDLACEHYFQETICAGRFHGWVAVTDDGTVVVVGDEMLGKPLDAADAVRMLSKLSGRDHRVITAVALALPDGRVLERFDVTRVWFRRLTAEQMRDYVATGDSLDKAGSYGVQSVGAVLVERVDGDFFSVMGLPIRLVTDLLTEGGMPYRFTR